MAEHLDFFIDADEEYVPAELPQGTVRMGGEDYIVRCPKDSMPMFMGRVEQQAQEAGEDAAAQEELMRQIAAAVFSPEDTEQIMERLVSPYDSRMTVAFLVDTVRRVYEAYAPYLDAAYEEVGLENPVKQPQDRLPKKATAKAAAKKTAAPRKAAAKKAAPARRAAPRR